MARKKEFPAQTSGSRLETSRIKRTIRKRLGKYENTE
jgi:hypothetical protein